MNSSILQPQGPTGYKVGDEIIILNSPYLGIESPEIPRKITDIAETGVLKCKCVVCGKEMELAFYDTEVRLA